MTAETIRVGKINIARAARKDSHRCMIADAIQHQIPHAKYIIVDTQSIRFSDVKRGTRKIYLTPPSAQKALLAFDAGRSVQPFTFTMSQGLTRTMRVRQGNYTPYPRKRRRASAKKKRYMPARLREFGLRRLTAR